MAKGQDGFTPLGPPRRGRRRRPGRDRDPRRRQRRGRAGRPHREPALPVRAAGRRPLALRDARARRHHPHRHARGLAPVEPGDIVEVELHGLSSVRNPVVEAGEPIAPFGAQPRVSPAARAAALGVNAPRAVHPLRERRAALRTVSTATLSVQISRRGVRNTFLRGLRPARPDLRLLGYAYTLRYVPLREDVRDADTAELNAQKTRDRVARSRRGARDRCTRRRRRRHDRRHPHRPRVRARRDGHRHRRRRARQSRARTARDADLLPGTARGRARADPLPARVERPDRVRRRARDAGRRDRRRRRGRDRRPGRDGRGRRAGRARAGGARDLGARARAGRRVGPGVYPRAARARPSSRPGGRPAGVAHVSQSGGSR